MPDSDDLDRRNDTRLITPLLIMALIVVVGILAFTYAGHAQAAGF